MAQDGSQKDLALHLVAGITVPPPHPLSGLAVGCPGWGRQPEPPSQGSLKVYIAVALQGAGGSPPPPGPAPSLTYS